MKSIVLFLLTFSLFTGPAFGQADIEYVVPQITVNDYQVDGLFGSNPKYSEQAIDIMNWVNARFDRLTLDLKVNMDMAVCGQTVLSMEEALICITDILKEDKTYTVDLFFYGKTPVTAEEAFSTIAEKHDLSSLSTTNWATAIPANELEAMERMAALLKTLNGGTPIP